MEIHAHFERQIAIGSAVDRVYDFALPPLLLHALYTGDAAPLRRWLAVRPAHLLARAVQFFTQGIPQVYYVGLLAGHNDMDLLARSRVGRDINRPVVAALVALIRFRNAHPAFAGHCRVGGDGSHVALTWTAAAAAAVAAQSAALDADLATGRATLTWAGPRTRPPRATTYSKFVTARVSRSRRGIPGDPDAAHPNHRSPWCLLGTRWK